MEEIGPYLVLNKSILIGRLQSLSFGYKNKSGGEWSISCKRKGPKPNLMYSSVLKWNFCDSYLLLPLLVAHTVAHVLYLLINKQKYGVKRAPKPLYAAIVNVG